MYFHLSVLFLGVVSVECGVLLTTNTLTDPLTTESEAQLSSVLDCFSNADMTTCLEQRAYAAIGKLFPVPNEELSNDVQSDDRRTELKTNNKDDAEIKMPEGMSPTVQKWIEWLGDVIASGISRFYPDDPKEISRQGRMDGSTTSLVTARGHKKKVKKALKKIAIKILLGMYVVQQAVKLFLYTWQTKIMFKFMIIAAVYVSTHVIKLWHFLKTPKEEHHQTKVVYLPPQQQTVTHHTVEEVHHGDIGDHGDHGHSHYGDHGHSHYSDHGNVGDHGQVVPIQYHSGPHDQWGGAYDDDNYGNRRAYYKQIPTKSRATGT